MDGCPTEIGNLGGGAHLWGKLISPLLGMWVFGTCRTCRERDAEIRGCMALKLGGKIALEYSSGVINVHI